MNTDFSTLCDQAERSSAIVLDNLKYIGSTLQDLQGELDKLPFFVRGFATSEISRGTGQDIAAWRKTASTLSDAVSEARITVTRVRDAGSVAEADRSIMTSVAERAEAERPRLQALVTFLGTIPSKLKIAPPGVFPADRRDEFLKTVDRQAQALRGTIDALPQLAEGLRALGELAT